MTPPKCLTKPLFLWGFMGSGKSTIGRTLATYWQIPFYDTDAMVEAYTGISIAQLFAEKGEATFRNYEQEILHAIPLAAASVVATGGGLPCYADNAHWMCNNGLTLYLHEAPHRLAQRLEQESDRRPLLQQRKGSDLLEYITSLLAERTPIYLTADYALDASSATPEAITRLLGSY